jgi:1-acyl-sn-glycerol-3-phosphate acyltransferase
MTAPDTDASLTRLPGFGLDADRITANVDESISARFSRRLAGRYSIDAFGADPLLTDALAPLMQSVMRVEVANGERLPKTGPAVLVSNRAFGVGEPLALMLGVRDAVGRRLRLVDAPDLPILGPLLRKFGGIGAVAADLGAALRAGHLVGVPLGPTWLRTGTGEPPIELLTAAVGFPVFPVAVEPIGPFGLALRGWRVTVGQMIELEPGLPKLDPLAAADLAELARDGVESLLATGWSGPKAPKQ